MMRIAALLAALLLVGMAAASAQGDFDWRLPPGVSPPPVPAANPMTKAKVELGRLLFYDTALSRDTSMSCGTCHEQKHAFADGKANHEGVGGVAGRRNVMGLADIGYFTPLTWADSLDMQLEDQAALPLTGEHPVEMGMSDAEISRRLSADPCYVKLFATAFPQSQGRIDRAAVTMALASFERTLISRDAPYDLTQRGGPALSPSARRGEALFHGAGHCAACHAGDDFTDLKFHHIGLYNVDGKGGYPAADPGLMEITGKAHDEGAIRTPSLRNVALTFPYMHDGAVKTLPAAIAAHLDAGNPRRDAELAGVRLSAVQVSDLVAFLQSLSDQAFVANPAFAAPPGTGGCG